MRRIYLSFLYFTVILATSSVQPKSQDKASDKTAAPGVSTFKTEFLEEKSATLSSALTSPRPCSILRPRFGGSLRMIDRHLGEHLGQSDRLRQNERRRSSLRHKTSSPGSRNKPISRSRNSPCIVPPRLQVSARAFLRHPVQACNNCLLGRIKLFSC